MNKKWLRKWKKIETKLSEIKWTIERWKNLKVLIEKKR